MNFELKSRARLGRYELLTQIGRGGMASVWTAKEWSPSGARQRLVAVKAMLPELARQPDFRSMFLEEGQLVRSIDHKNVVKVHEVAEDHGILYMAMEWVEGDSLRAVIKEAKRRRAIPPEMAVRIIADTAAGLHAAHELRGWDGELRNLVHCDVSPHNILVGLDGRSKLVDFGVANATVHSDLGSNDTIKGKFGYMSPEQAQGKAIDRRSDIFALGIVLFELTTGERLFRGENPAHTLRLVTSGEIPNPRDVHPKYPEKLAEIVATALERDLDRRYQTADELRAALERYLVEARIMVSVASVGQLVKRVLGQRIEQQRALLREALVAADGTVQDGLVPTTAIRDASHSGPDHSNPGTDPFANSRRSPHSLSDPPTGSQSQASGNSAPFYQTLDSPPPRRRSPLGGLMFAVLGVAAATGAIVFAQTRQQQSLIGTPVFDTKVVGASSQGPVLRSESNASGIDIDDLPIDQKAKERDQRGPAPNANKKASKEEKAEKKKEEAAPAKEPAKEPAAEVAPPPPPPPPPASDEPAGPFNRGAAMAALGGASLRAASCKRPDGPTGGGRAQVTFAPNGSVSAVVVPAPFAGTPVGNCVSAVFKGGRVPAFEGSAITLPQSFRIPE